MGQLYTLGLPAPGAPDVVRRQITQTINGGDPSTFDATDGMALRYQVGAVVTLKLNDFDAAGNESPDSPEFDITITDTNPPAAPGALGLVASGEDDNMVDNGPV